MHSCPRCGAPDFSGFSGKSGIRFNKLSRNDVGYAGG
jgi:hypothetical protein